jgi:hypothetical protein
MAEVLPLPNLGDVFADVRAEDRAMRVSYHPDADVLVISLWSGRTCRATFQLPGRDLGRLSTLLTDIAARQPPAQPAQPAPPAPEPEQPPTAEGGPGPAALAS